MPSNTRKSLSTTVALSLILAAAPMTMSAANAAAALSPVQLASATFAFERSTSISDERFIELLREELANRPEQTEAVVSKAKELRPYLSGEIEVASAELGSASSASGQTAAAGGSAASGAASAGAPVAALAAGGAALVGGGVLVAASGGGGGDGGKSKSKNPEPKDPPKGEDPKDPDPKDPDPKDPDPKDPPEVPEEPGPGPKPPEARDFETPEYGANYGMFEIGAAHAYAKGYTGEGVKVAVIDTGIDVDHPEFAGRIENPYNAYNDTTDVTDPDGHGTHVAGIIAAAKDDIGSHGVAFNSTIIPISISTGVGENIDTGDNLEFLARGLDHAVSSGARVINNSYGMTFSDWDGSRLDLKEFGLENFTDFYPELVAAYDNLVANDVIMVAATGNDWIDGGLDQADFPASSPLLNDAWVGNWIAVGALDGDGKRAEWSNACGDAAEWCLFAPGQQIYAPGLEGEYDYRSGTSMATPMVTGGVALLREAFPHLDASDITSILFETADSLGPKEIYGHGAMNLERAFQPIGTVAVPMGSNVDDRSISLNGSSLRVSAAFGDGIGRGLQGHSVMGLDKYNRGFEFDMGNFVTPAHHDTRKDALHRLKLFGGIEERSISTIDAGPFSITTATRLRASDPGLGHTPYSRMSFGFTSGSVDVEASMNPDMGRSFGFREAGFGGAPMMDAKSFDQPHLALMETGFGSSFGFGLTENSSFQMAAFSGNVAAEEDVSFADTPSMFGGVGQLTTHFGDSLTVKAAAGAVSEEGSLLGSVSKGAFGEDMKSNTMFVNLGATVDLAQNTKLTFAGSLGQSSFKQNAGLVRSGEDIVTTSFGVGVSHRGLFQDGDVFSLAAAQPLRVESGKVNLSIPTSRNLDGSIGYTQFGLNPQPSGREVNLQASYGFRVLDGIETSVGAMHRFDANHVKGANETIGMISASFRF